MKAKSTILISCVDRKPIVAITQQDAAEPESASSADALEHLTILQKQARARCRDAVQLIGLDDYLNSLEVRGNQEHVESRILATVLSRMGGTVLIPIIGLLPSTFNVGLVRLKTVLSLIPSAANIVSAVELTLAYNSRRVAQQVLDSGEAQADRLPKPGEGAPTSVDAAAGMNVELASDELSAANSAPSDSMDALTLMADGALGFDLPNPFDLEKMGEICDLLKNQELSDEEQQAARRVPEPTPVDLELLPDLYFGDGHLKYLESPAEHARSRIFSCILNRLALNVPIEAGLVPSCRKLFAVLVEGKPVYDVGSLVKALQETGHEVTTRFCSDVTSFGLSFCVKKQESELASTCDSSPFMHVGVGMPFRTGIQPLDGPPGDEIVVLLPHTCVEFRVRGKYVQLKCAIQAYQGTEGFTGFQSGQDVDRRWQNDKAVYVTHGSMLDSAQCVQVMQLFGLCAVVNNLVSRDCGLWKGGYLVLGTCVDSVAWVQQALLGSTSMFPLMLHGKFKTQILLGLQRLSVALRTQQRDEKTTLSLDVSALEVSLKSLETALAELPCDISVEPLDVADACQRILATMPAESPFATVQRARTQAGQLLEQITRAVAKDQEQKPTPMQRQDSAPQPLPISLGRGRSLRVLDPSSGLETELAVDHEAMAAAHSRVLREALGSSIRTGRR
ncbi:hypothetical protein FVE85_1631 [Porphyridium purpureum]|uniref:Uncharacterized protein n=1 Tax=Porphyridium purpureum TaxID=35688 RepID=A0A5J4YVT9_PORPP|nr:hypothetical protein FVE85_1631 [Porphyridium purpureum]|eukprot:POR7415..scf209_3